MVPLKPVEPPAIRGQRLAPGARGCGGRESVGFLPGCRGGGTHDPVFACGIEVGEGELGGGGRSDELHLRRR